MDARASWLISPTKQDFTATVPQPIFGAVVKASGDSIGEVPVAATMRARSWSRIAARSDFATCAAAILLNECLS